MRYFIFFVLCLVFGPVQVILTAFALYVAWVVFALLFIGAMHGGI